MVAYRSFAPFFPLLGSWDIPGVQLWAVWAIRHVCSKNADRYREMFEKQGGCQAIREVKDYLDSEEKRGSLDSTRSLVKEITEDILYLICR